MKLFLTLALLASVATMASAAPFIVFSGSATGSITMPSGTTPVPKNALLFYLVADVTDTSKYTLLQLNATDLTYGIDSRPSSSPSADESINNFLGSVILTTGKSGTAIFTYQGETTSTDNVVTVAHAYATGALTLTNLALVPARTKPVVVTLKTNGATTGTFTFSTLTPAITAGHNPAPKALTGTLNTYSIDADGNITLATTTGTLSVKLDTVVTGLINIGGGLTAGKNTFAVQPLTPSGGSITDDFSAWLTTFATDSGYALAP